MPTAKADARSGHGAHPTKKGATQLNDLLTAADEIAAALGPGWMRRPSHNSPWSVGIVRNDKLSLQITASGQRLEITAYDAIDYPVMLCPKITCAATHSSVAIAAAIRRRLLPEAEAQFAERQAARIAEQKAEQTLEDIRRQFLNIPNVRTDAQARMLYGPGFALSVRDPDNIRLTFHAVALPVVTTLLNAFYQQ